MRFLHLADLHIGKKVNEFSMIDNQRFMLDEVIRIAEEKNIDAILIAGDIYDKGIPSEEAVKVFNKFITEINNRKITIFAISGNHDSANRLDFGSSIMENTGVFIYGKFNGQVKKISVDDDFGKINIYMLPFVTPDSINAFSDEKFDDYTSAIDFVIKSANINKEERNILIAHQFVTKAGEEVERCMSETTTVGGVDNVDSFVFDDFDYVALGHLHSPRKVGREEVRYSGSPIKYSFSEVNHKKSVPIIDINEKGNIKIELIEIKQNIDMREIKGLLEDILEKDGNKNDYIRAIITNEELIYDAIGKIRNIYPNVMRVEFENKRSKSNNNAEIEVKEVSRKEPTELFEEFFEKQNNIKMSQEQIDIIEKLFNGGDF